MGQGRYVNKTATILAGQSLSNAVDCTAGGPAFLHMPPAWTAAMISFQVSPDGVSYNDLCDSSTVEATFNVLAGTSINLDESVWRSVLYFKVRSGSCRSPIVQEADRTINITVDTA